MKKQNILIVLILAISFTGLQAQKLVPGEKSKNYLSFLKGQSSLNVVFEYDNMEVGKMDEKAYIEKKKEEYNKKEAGRGDTWAERWVEDRERRFEPKFFDLFNKYTQKKGLKAGKDMSEAEYTMTVKTTWTEPGYYVGISARPAYISGEISFSKTGEKKVIASIKFTKAPGNSMGATWDTGERIKESYAKLGKTLGAYLIKKALK